MAKKNETGRDDSEVTTQSGLSRREFVKSGAAATLTAAALIEPSTAQAQRGSRGASGIDWDYEVDVVIAGGGCAGLTAAIRARDLGATVLVVDQNFDLGGRMLHSGSFVSLGGGDPLQRRDTKGESDKEGFVTAPPVEDPAELDDDVELLFKDITDWSVLNRRGETPYRYNERELVRAWAENCPATRQFLIDNYVRFGRINGTHEGGGMSRARGAVCFLMLGDKTDIKAGTITAEDAGVADKERTSAFAPVQMNIASRFVGPNAVSNGVALARPLEFSAREKGVEFMLHRCFDELVREQPSAGRILGLRAHYSPRNHPETGELLQSYWQNGNIDERRETIHDPRAQGRDPREWRARGQPGSAQHVLSGDARAGVPDERRLTPGPAWSGCERADRGLAGRREFGRHAAEFRLRGHVSHLDAARHARCVYRHDAGSPDIRLPRLIRGQRRLGRLRRFHRREPGRQALLQRGAAADPGRRRSISGRRRRAEQRHRA